MRIILLGLLRRSIQISFDFHLILSSFYERDLEFKLQFQSYVLFVGFFRSTYGFKRRHCIAVVCFVFLHKPDAFDIWVANDAIIHKI